MKTLSHIIKKLFGYLLISVLLAIPCTSIWIAFNPHDSFGTAYSSSVIVIFVLGIIFHYLKKYPGTGDDIYYPDDPDARPNKHFGE